MRLLIAFLIAWAMLVMGGGWWIYDTYKPGPVAVRQFDDPSWHEPQSTHPWPYPKPPEPDVKLED